MKTFVLMTRMIREEVEPSFALEEREKRVSEKVGAYLPEVRWVSCYAVMGPWDYLDVFEAEDDRQAMKVSALVRYYGACHTELWPVQPWGDFKSTIRDLAQVMER